jgi:hypothetical protein
MDERPDPAFNILVMWALGALLLGVFYFASYRSYVPMNDVCKKNIMSKECGIFWQ